MELSLPKQDIEPLKQNYIFCQFSRKLDFIGKISFLAFFLCIKCDLLWENGPTAVKRFKTQLTAFSQYMLCNIFTSAS